MEITVFDNPINNSIAKELLKIAINVHDSEAGNCFGYDELWNVSADIYQRWVGGVDVQDEMEAVNSGLYAERLMEEYGEDYLKAVEQETKRKSEPVGCHEITNVGLDYTGGGIWLYHAQYGPYWLLGTLDEYINAYDVDAYPYSDMEYDEFDWDGHLADNQVTMPTWKDIIDSIKKQKDFPNADECVNIIRECNQHLYYSCNE